MSICNVSSSTTSLFLLDRVTQTSDTLLSSDLLCQAMCVFAIHGVVGDIEGAYWEPSAVESAHVFLTSVTPILLEHLMKPIFLRSQLRSLSNAWRTLMRTTNISENNKNVMGNTVIVPAPADYVTTIGELLFSYVSLLEPFMQNSTTNNITTNNSIIDNSIATADITNPSIQGSIEHDLTYWLTRICEAVMQHILTAIDKV